MPRLVLVALLLAVPPEAPRTLPEDVNATRIAGGVVRLQTGEGVSLLGDTTVGPGWYFTALGYQRLFEGRAELEQRYTVMRAQHEALRDRATALETQLEHALVKAEGCGQLAAATCAAAAANAAGYSVQSVYLVALLGAAIGVALGLLLAVLLRARPSPG